MDTLGAPVDVLDSICRKWNKCNQCSSIDYDGCVGFEQDYGQPLIDQNTLNFSCEHLNNNECSKVACQCDVALVDELSAFALEYNPSYSSGESSFDVGTCERDSYHSTAKIDSCCGEYPNRFPFSSQSGVRQCCHGKTYDSTQLSCCADGHVANQCAFDPCVPNPCENGGQCAHGEYGQAVCSCASGFEGVYCETESRLTPSILCTEPLELVMLVDNSGRDQFNAMGEIKSIIGHLANQISFGQIVKTGLVSFDRGVDVQFQIGNHSPAFIKKKLTKIRSSDNNSDLASLNNGIQQASKLFTSDNGILVIFSDFFSTDFTYPDTAVASLLHEGIRTLAVGVGEHVMHSHWFTAGMMQEANTFMAKDQKSIARLSEDISSYNCVDDKQRLTTYQEPTISMPSDNVVEASKTYQLTGVITDELSENLVDM